MQTGVTPQKQLMLEFRNTEEQYVLTSALATFNSETQEELSTALVAYLRFGIRRQDFEFPFVQGIFDNLVSYLDFTRGKAEQIPTDEFPSPVLYAMAYWYDQHPDKTVMFSDNSQHVHTYADVIACFPQLEEPIRQNGHKPTDLVEGD